MPTVGLLTLVAGFLAIVCLALADEGRLGRDCVRRLIAIGVVMAGAATAWLTFAPIYVDDGALCIESPSTDVLGRLGSSARIDSLPEGQPRELARLCARKARIHVGLGGLLLVVSGAAYGVARKRRTDVET